MFHQTINGLVHGILFNQEPIILTTTHLLAAIAVILIPLGLAILSYVFLEKPIQLYGRELVNRISRENLFIPNKASLT
jgi:peptidoglycan/LPS O-acetylase OafA/YrhL